MAVGDVATVRVHYQQVNQDMYNMFQFLQVDSGTTFIDLVNLWIDDPTPTVLTQLRAMLPSNCVISDFYVHWARSLSNDELTVTINLAGTGAVGVGSALPQNCQLIKWTTGYSGRRWRGRSYLPFPGGSTPISTTTGLYGTVQLTNAVAFINAMGAAFSQPSSPWKLVIFSRKEEADNPGYVPAPVIAGSYDIRPAVQRRCSVISGAD